MREDIRKQIICVQENNAIDFQNKVNAALAGLTDPEIRFDETQPFTLYIIYEISKVQPETILELLEMLDKDGGKATCKECPFFTASYDGRRRTGACSKRNRDVHRDARACEDYYRNRRLENAQLAKELENIPYLIK